MVPYGILQCTLRCMYNSMVRVNSSIPHVLRIIAFTRFLFLLQLSLSCIVARGCPRSSAAARISRPSRTTDAFPTNDHRSSTHHPVIFRKYLYLWLYTFFSSLRLLVVLPHVVIPTNKNSTTILAAAKRSLPHRRVHESIFNKYYTKWNKNKWLENSCASGKIWNKINL